MGSNLAILLFFSSSSIICFFFLHLVSPHPNVCSNEFCKKGEQGIRFPFCLKQFQPDERCVYPGFDLSCNGQNQTTISIPLSGEFNVISIDYARRVIWLQDPDNCLPKRLHNFTTLNSSWLVQQYTEFKFFKCPMKSGASNKFARMPCLDGQKYQVVIVATDDLPRYEMLLMDVFRCTRSHDISIPTIDGKFTPEKSEFGLTWNQPSDCSVCETLGETCVFKGKKGLETTCTLSPPHPGMHPCYGWFYKMLSNNSSSPFNESPKGKTIGPWILPGITSTACVMCFVSFIAWKLRVLRLAQQDRASLSSPPGRSQAPVIGLGMTQLGMDSPTIESFPKTRVGDAGGSMPQDNGCSICLTEYKRKEELRTLPECKHSFHANCIDPWLKGNGHCPLCRNDQGYAKSMDSIQGEEEDFPYADYTIGN